MLEKWNCEIGITKHWIENSGQTKLRNWNYETLNWKKLEKRNCKIAKLELRNIEFKMLEKRNCEIAKLELRNLKAGIAKCETGIANRGIENVGKMKLRNCETRKATHWIYKIARIKILKL